MTRKLISMFVAAAALVTAPLTAQSRFGIVGGLVSSNLTISGGGVSASFSSRTGFAGGLSMTHPISKDLEFAPELLYVQKGSKLTEGSTSFAVKLGYVELPLLFRAKFGSSATRPFVLAGPAIGVKASCKFKGSDGSTSVSADCGTDFKVKSTDFGAMFGAGIAANRYSVSVRYDLGLSNIADGADAGSTAKNRTFLLLVGISL